MRKIVILLIAVTACIGCIFVFQSSFSSTFSLQELVQRNQSNSGLNCSGSGGAGGGSGGIATVAGGVGENSFHKGESFSCQISDADRFDETKFIQALKESVEKDLDASQAKITSNKSPDPTHFAIEYTMGNTAGRIEISGTRSAGYYSLQAQLDEKKGC